MMSSLFSADLDDGSIIDMVLRMLDSEKIQDIECEVVDCYLEWLLVRWSSL